MAATSKTTTDKPVLAPPQTEQDDPTVLESVTNVTREYGGAVASQFIRLRNNMANAPSDVAHLATHGPLGPQQKLGTQ